MLLREGMLLQPACIAYSAQCLTEITEELTVEVIVLTA